MKNLFPGYYRPTDDEFEELWANCTFVPDTNVLLNLYRTSPSAKETLMEIFEQISDRLWIPHQVALEYQTRRLGVISKQLHAYREVQEYLQKEAGAISGKLSEYRRHAFLDIDLLNARIEKVFSSIRKQVEKQQKVHPDWLGNDPIHEELTTLFEGKVGIPYTDEQLQAIHKDAEQRYERKQPPGFRDEKKDENKYGDVVLWRQFLDYAANQRTPVIFVTDDTKDDWWHRHEGRTISPHPKLIEEFRNNCNVAFYMYDSNQFAKWAQKYLERNDKPEVLNELRELREIDEVETSFEAFLRSTLEVMRRNEEARQAILQTINRVPLEELMRRNEEARRARAFDLLNNPAIRHPQLKATRKIEGSLEQENADKNSDADVPDQDDS